MRRARISYVVIAAGCIGVGLACRAVGLPVPVAKYSGSMLWAAMVYFAVRALLPDGRIIVAVTAAGLFATLGEMTQLLSVPGFNEFRDKMIGHLVFGRTFAVEDIAAYWIGILVVAAGDHWFGPRHEAPAMSRDLESVPGERRDRAITERTRSREP